MSTTFPSERIGTEAIRPRDPACDWSRLVTYRPHDGARVRLNPPRFSWPYLPGVFPSKDDAVSSHEGDGFAVELALFTFEIAGDPAFRETDMLFRAERTPFNFFNAIPALPSGKTLFWRVAYLDAGGRKRCWSAARRFTVEPDAAVWEREDFEELPRKDRPRLLPKEQPERGSAGRAGELGDGPEIRASVRRAAERVLRRSWWKKLPQSDRISREAFRQAYPDSAGNDFTGIASDLATLAFWRRLSGEGDLAEIAAMAAHVAAYPVGGLSGPEGSPGSLGADVAQLPEFLAVTYDLCHDAADPDDLRALREGIAWRVRYTLDNFAWRTGGGARMPRDSIALSSSSHPFESGMGMLAAGPLLAGDPDLNEEQRAIFETIYRLGVHWLVGVTNAFGTEDGWNEGPGYGNSKCQWLMNAVSYYDLARPSLRLGKNPALKAIGDFFLYSSPLGLRAAPFSNGSAKQDYVVRNRMSSAYRLAYLLNDGTFRRTWEQSHAALEQLGVPDQLAEKRFWRPWLCFGLAARSAPPPAADAPAGMRHFEHSGWICAFTESPNRFDRGPESSGIVLQARPMGGYQHSFFSDGSPQLWAFGEPLNYTSGSTANKDRFAYSAMSANTVLVNGIGQRHLSHWRKEHFLQARLPKQIARFAAFQKLRGGGFYALCDLTNGYATYAGPAGHWWGELEGPYQDGPLPKVTRALRHVLFLRQRYFVLLDEIALDPQAEPATFTWLWHVFQKGKLELAGPGRVRYPAGRARVDLVHVHEPSGLELEDREGLDGALNPFSGEDYREDVRRSISRPSGEAQLMAHNLWFSDRARARERKFLAVVYPTRAGEAAPVIASAGPLAVRVAGPHGEDLIDFNGPAHHAEASLVVEADVLAEAAGRERSD